MNALNTYEEYRLTIDKINFLSQSENSDSINLEIDTLRDLASTFEKAKYDLTGKISNQQNIGLSQPFQYFL